MYEWVVKRLQYAEMEHIKHGEDKLAVLCRDAADAIEELQAQNNELLFRYVQAKAWIDYYQTGKLLSNEPPKEEV